MTTNTDDQTATRYHLTTVKRKNRNGVACVAPFINGWNVWDIPEKMWTDEVQMAVKHAYELGYNRAIKLLVDTANKNGNYIMNDPWIPENDS
jgi:hypothetical protein